MRVINVFRVDFQSCILRAANRTTVYRNTYYYSLNDLQIIKVIDYFCLSVVSDLKISHSVV